MKIKAVAPVVVPPEECRKRERGVYQDAGLRPDTKIEFVTIPKGPDYLSYYTECLDSDYNVFLEACKAEKEGYDAVQPDCVFDPAVKPLKEVLNIPVAAPLECSIHLASLLGRKMSIMINEAEMIKFIDDKVKDYGFEHKVASVLPTGITFEELGFATGTPDKKAINRKLRATGKKAIEEDGADVLIYAWTACFGVGDLLMKDYGVPILEPGAVAAKMAEMLVDLGLKQSKRAYPTPTKDVIPK